MKIVIGRHMAHGLAIVITTHQVFAFADPRSSATEQLRYRLNIACRVTKSIWHESGGMTVSFLQKSFEIDPDTPERFTLDDEELRDESNSKTILNYLFELEYLPSQGDTRTKDGVLILYLNAEYFGEFKFARSRFEKGSFEQDVSAHFPGSILRRVASGILGPKVKIKFKVECDSAYASWKKKVM
ncbi:MAG: hypothetical protein IPJ71_08675 [Bdellovibrionales bacterium]|nr:hypothetical protein [Bdellovibrionales bacterium]